jgi:hypothetical protein
VGVVASFLGSPPDATNWRLDTRSCTTSEKSIKIMRVMMAPGYPANGLAQNKTLGAAGLTPFESSMKHQIVLVRVLDNWFFGSLVSSHRGGCGGCGLGTASWLRSKFLLPLPDFQATSNSPASLGLTICFWKLTRDVSPCGLAVW